MSSVDDMIREIYDLENKRYDISKQIVGEKIKSILELAKAGEKIPYQLELSEEDMILLEGILSDKELVDNRDGKDDKLYLGREIDGDESERNGTLVKIGNILLCLYYTGGSYYITPEDFAADFEERKNNNENLENFLYFKVDSLEEKEFFELFMGREAHDISEVEAVIADRTVRGIGETADAIGIESRPDTQQGINPDTQHDRD